MRFASLVLLVFSVFICEAVFSNLSLAQTHPPDIKVELNAAGLATLSQLVKDEMLGDVSDQRLPDIDREVFGFAMKARGLNLKFVAESLDLVANQGDLELKLGLRDLVLSVDSFALKRDVLGFDLHTSCAKTVFAIGENSTVFFRTKLNAAIRGRDVVLSDRGIYFPILGQDYSVLGPQSCDDSRGDLTRLALNFLFKILRPALEPMIRYQIQSLLPVIAAHLTAQANFRLGIDFTRFPDIQPQTLMLSTHPQAVEFGSGRVSLELGVEFDSEPENRQDTPMLASNGGRSLGSLAINPNLITQAVAAIFPAGTPWFEIDESLSANLRSFLAIDSLAALWPDLKLLMLDEPFARLKMRLSSMPQFGVDASREGLTMMQSGLELKFMVKLGGQWRDYSLLHLDISSGVIPMMQGRMLKLSLLPSSDIMVHGVFADSYDPTNPFFDQSAADNLAKALLEAGIHRDSIAVIDMPPFWVYGRPLAFGDVKTTDAMIRVELESAPLP